MGREVLKDDIIMTFIFALAATVHVQYSYLQSCDFHGYLEGKRRQNANEQRPARGIAALQISNTTINRLFRPYVTKCWTVLSAT